MNFVDTVDIFEILKLNYIHVIMHFCKICGNRKRYSNDVNFYDILRLHGMDSYHK